MSGVTRAVVQASLWAMLLAASMSASAAGTTRTVTIKQTQSVASSNVNIFVVILSSPATGSPSCATETDRFVVSPSTPGGMAMIANLLSAYATGATVTITGNGACDVYPDMETIYSVYVQPG